MPRVVMMIAIALVAGLAGGAASQFFLPSPEPAPDRVAIRTVVEDVLAQRAEERESAPVNTASLDRETLDPMIEDYLMSDPRILQRVSDALQEQLRREDAEQARLSLAEYHEEIYEDPSHVVLGNPDGDVTIVEFFDYNCPYCRQSMPDLAALIAEDPDLRVILKEFPILSDQSVAAARIAVAVAEKAGDDYWRFHEALFTGRGQVNRESALAAAEEIGLNPVDVELDASSQSVTRTLERSYRIAEGLEITGTPTYIIGDEIVPGAVGYEALKSRIDNMRSCGSTVCAAGQSQTADAG